MRIMKLFLIKNLWWVTFIFALTLLVFHSFNIATLSVDSTSILLLLIMLISPFVAAIKKIKFGEFEAEIDPKEIQRIKTEAEKNIDFSPQESNKQPVANKTAEAINEIAASDTVLALAKIRIEIEKILQQIAKTSSIETTRLTLGALVKKLSTQEIITIGVASALLEVVAICNRAIHGEAISEDSANTIIGLGVELIEDLQWLYKQQAVMAPVTTEEIISMDEVGEYYEKKKYRLTSIIPLTNNPKKVIRELTQEQLEEVLENYNEYAEFIVELTEIKQKG